MDDSELFGTGIIEWSCPIPVFGNIERSRVATLGINPSCREFLDKSGMELRGIESQISYLEFLGT